MRYNDTRNGTDVVHGVLERYKASWEKIGIVAESGLFVDMYLVEQGARISQGHIGFSAWYDIILILHSIASIRFG